MARRQATGFSLSLSHDTSLPSHSFSLCPSFSLTPEEPLSVTRFRTGTLLAFALTSAFAPPSFSLSSSILLPFSPFFPLNSRSSSSSNSSNLAQHHATPHTHRFLSLSFSFSFALPPTTRYPLHTPERAEDSLLYIPWPMTLGTPRTDIHRLETTISHRNSIFFPFLQVTLSLSLIVFLSSTILASPNETSRALFSNLWKLSNILSCDSCVCTSV